MLLGREHAGLDAVPPEPYNAVFTLVVVAALFALYAILPDAGFDDVGADVGVCEPPLTVTVPFEALPLYSFSVDFEAASRDETETS